MGRAGENEIVGDGPVRAALEQQVQKLGLGDVVVFEGFQDDVKTWLLKADVFCYASEYDSFGQVLIEAMVAGLPLITSDYGPFGEINEHGVTGLLVKSGDGQAFADALRWVAEHREEAVQMGGNARCMVKSRFSQERMIDETLALYGKVAV